MNPSIEAQASIRKNVEEQGLALNDFNVWETTIKQNDAMIKKKNENKSIQSSTIVGGPRLSSFADDKSNKRNNNSIDDVSDLGRSIPEFAGRSNSMLIGRGQQFGMNSKNPVARAPHMEEVTTIQKPTKSKEEFENDERQRGNTFFSAGDYQGAIKCYSQCIQLNPASAIAYSNRGERRRNFPIIFYNQEREREIKINNY